MAFAAGALHGHLAQPVHANVVHKGRFTIAPLPSPWAAAWARWSPCCPPPPRLPRDERLLDAENLWSNVRPLAGGPAYTEIMCHGNKFGPFFPQGGHLRPGVRPQAYGGEALER